MFPKDRLRRLRDRRTQVVAFELWAAAMALLTFVVPEGAAVRHFVDNKAALGCLVNAFSRQHDLNNIAGGVLHRCSQVMAHAIFDFVRSEENVADGPSRGDLTLMRYLGAKEVPAVVPDWHVDSLDWIKEWS